MRRLKDQTLRRKLLMLIRQFPGTLAGNIPRSQRRFLRELEQEDMLECRVEANAFRWYCKKEGA
jgi:hypothetical protein